MNGWLLLDKPTGITSREAVNRVQTWFARGTKLGHTGTLDPLATGLLVLGVGAATRLAEYVQEQGKSYRSRFRLGATSDTDDADGEIQESESRPVSEAELRAALGNFLGVIDQVPPGYSAVKVAGKRAHKLARAGHDVQLAPRQVRIDRLELLSYTWPYVELEIECGKGTYIRSLARDLGRQLGCGGLVQTLRRTRVGNFHVENALSLESTWDLAHQQLLPLDAGLEQFRSVTLPPEWARRFQQGQRLPVSDADASEVRVYAPDFLGLGEVRAGGLFPRVVVRPVT